MELLALDVHLLVTEVAQVTAKVGVLKPAVIAVVVIATLLAQELVIEDVLLLVAQTALMPVLVVAMELVVQVVLGIVTVVVEVIVVQDVVTHAICSV